MMSSDTHSNLWKRLLFTVAPFVALLAGFAVFAFVRPPENVASLMLAALSAFLAAYLWIRFVPQWMQAWSGAPELDAHAADGKRSGRWQRMHPVLAILLGATFLRLALFALAYAVLLWRGGYSGGLWDTIALWSGEGGDGRYLLYLAEHWYGGAAEELPLLAFFPLYPVLVRGANAFFHSYLVSGLFVSNVCAVVSGVLLYELALVDMKREAALRTLKFYCILPATLALSAPLPDSLFLLLALLTLLLARKKRYLVACIAGFFASLAEYAGVLLFVPVAFLLVADIVRERKNGNHGGRFVFQCVRNSFALLLIPAGLGLFLALNQQLVGDAGAFLSYRSAYWLRSPGWFFESVARQADLAYAAAEAGESAQLFVRALPALAALLIAPAVVAASQKKLRPVTVLTFLLLFLSRAGAANDLSVVRDLMAVFPVPMALGLLTERRWVNALLTALCVLGLLLAVYALAAGWIVY